VFASIKTGITGELMVEVVSGVPAGEEIITGPFKALREIKDGDRVKKMSEKEKKAAEGQGAGTS
jgi:HlyD family secretion protein